MTTTETTEQSDVEPDEAPDEPRKTPQPGPNGEKPICRSLCGWCGSGQHKRCEDRDGFILFTNGVYHGNQCKCHDTVDPATGKGHAYVIERTAPKELKPSARRKTKR